MQAPSCEAVITNWHFVQYVNICKSPNCQYLPINVIYVEKKLLHKLHKTGPLYVEESKQNYVASF